MDLKQWKLAPGQKLILEMIARPDGGSDVTVILPYGAEDT